MHARAIPALKSRNDVVELKPYATQILIFLARWSMVPRAALFVSHKISVACRLSPKWSTFTHALNKTDQVFAPDWGINKSRRTDAIGFQARQLLVSS